MNTLGRYWRALRPYALPTLVFLAVVLAISWRVWTPVHGAQRTFGWDAIWEYWGDLQFQVDALADGEFPLWNPYDRTGYPFHADPQAGVLYPPNWPLVGLGLALGSTPWWLIAVKVIGHFTWAALGVFAFLRRRGQPLAACYAGGLVLILSYPFLHQQFSALNWSMAWAPWMVLAVDAWAERPTVKRGGLLGGTVAMAMLAGGLASFWYGLLTAIPYGIWALVHHARASESTRAYVIKASRSLAVAMAIFVSLVAAQVVATQGVVQASVRAKRDLAFFGTSVFGPNDLLGFFVPRMHGENTYLGFGAILWIGILIGLRPTPRTLVLSGVFVFAVLCAFGDRGPLLPLLGSIFEPFGMFRRAHRYMYAAMLPVAILAGEGLGAMLSVDSAERRIRLRRAVVWCSAGAALVCAIGFAVKVDHPWKDHPVRDAFGFGVASIVLAAAASYLALSHQAAVRRRFAVVAVVVLGLDLWFARVHTIDRSMHEVPRPMRDNKALAQADIPLAVRIYDSGFLKYRPGIRLGIRDFGGYEDDPLALRRYHALLNAGRGGARQLGHANVGFLFEEGGGTRKTALDNAVLEPLSGGGMRLNVVAPAVAWYDSAELVADEGDAEKKLLATQPGSKAFVEGRGVSSALKERLGRVDLATPVSGAPPAGRYLSLSRNRLVAEIDAPADGLVVLAEAYYRPGWTATVDGKPAEILPANLYARGVAVTAGVHTIEMVYQASGYLSLVVLEFTALLLLGVALLFRRRLRRILDA